MCSTNARLKDSQVMVAYLQLINIPLRGEKVLEEDASSSAVLAVRNMDDV